jgi:hypothetical protein
MLEHGLDVNERSIITWQQPHGRAFLVLHQARFVSELLPNWFRQNKYQSFQVCGSFGSQPKLYVALTLQNFPFRPNSDSSIRTASSESHKVAIRYGLKSRCCLVLITYNLFASSSTVRCLASSLSAGSLLPHAFLERAA